MSVTNQWSLFGIDLTRVGEFVALGVGQLLWSDEAGLRARWYPAAQLCAREGVPCYCDEYGAEVPAETLKDDATQAFSLDEDLFLLRNLSIPANAESDLATAVRMDIDGNSPFAPEDLCSGWRVMQRSQAMIHVTSAIASRAAIHAWLRRNDATQTVLEDRIEVWARVDERQHIVMDGFGEQARRRQYFLNLRAHAARTGLLLACTLGVLLMPGIYAEIRKNQLEDQLDLLTEQTRSATQLREQLTAQRESIDALSLLRRERTPYHYWLHELSAMSPDSVYLTRLEFEGTQAEATGFADNAADYLSQLAESQRFDDIKAPGAFTRDRNTGRERFAITLTLPSPEAL